jgi:ferredoxin
MKIKIDQDKCIGCGACESLCPDTFKIDGEKAKIKKAVIKQPTYEKDAKDACPVGAIEIDE